MPAVVAKLKGLMPYAGISLVLPGGSIIALLLWLYRRHGTGALRSPAARGRETPSPATTVSPAYLKEAVCTQACSATALSTMGRPMSTLEENDSLPSHHPTISATGGLT